MTTAGAIGHRRIRPGRHRSAARLSAVQALYEMDLAETPADPVLQAFITDRWRSVDDGRIIARPDQEFLSAVVKGVVERLAEIDGHVTEFLTGNWTVARLEPVIRAALRAGVFELLARPDVPARVVVSEYVGVADAFYDGREGALINGVLDKIARRVRPGELEADANPPQDETADGDEGDGGDGGRNDGSESPSG